MSQPAQSARRTVDVGTRQAIARYILGQAEWRERTAVEYPEDSRNAQGAARLRSLATHVLSRPDNDEVLRELATFATTVNIQPLDA